MTSIREMIRRRFAPIQPLPPGIYHYQAPATDPRNFRLHLRLEPDGSGILIVNAATILHLNQTAAEFAYHLIQRTPEDQVVQAIASRYQIGNLEARQDYRDFSARIDTLVSTPDLDPVTFLDFERSVPYSVDISAPYRLDCAPTYQLPATADLQAAPTKRVTNELARSDWETVIDKAWQVGVPHIVFTGGEPTLRADLLQLIARTESNGQVSGLLTDGFKLADPVYRRDLLQTGLDHLLVILYPDEELSWTVLRAVAGDDIFTAAHITITPQNESRVPEFLRRLKSIQVNGISLSASAPGLSEQLRAARELVASLNLELVWDLPVPYSGMNPVTLEVVDHERVEGGGKAWLYVEPDGDVLPAQGINKFLGNFVTDPWEKIWSAAKAARGATG